MLIAYHSVSTQNGKDGLKFIMRNTEVREDIPIVYENWMAAECRLLNFVIILAVSLFCIALF